MKSCTVFDCKLPLFKNVYCIDHLRQFGPGKIGGPSTSAAPDQKYQDKFKDLCAKPTEDQTELFLKSFIFDLGDKWKELNALEKAFRKRLSDANEAKNDLNPVMAADFLQKNGLERTAIQRKDEIADVDLDQNDRISFIEYLLLHYKVMILNAYYNRTQKSCPYDLTRGGLGLTGVGAILLEELFTMPVGLSPELEAAIEAFTAQKKARESKLAELTGRAALGGVKGLAAQNEIKQMEAADMTDTNRIELTLNAAKKRGMRDSGEVALQKRKQVEEEAAKKLREDSRSNLAARAALFGGQ